jgi:lipopolysaccharide transport system ATP-binding protein
LAFAVGAHLEPEVLIVDEVLAVGDQQFQKKCLDKMHDIGEEGRTVIFVSHSMQAITRLCQRALLLDKGNLVADGQAAQVVGTYLHAGFSSQAEKEWSDITHAPGDRTARLRAVRVKNLDGQIADTIDIRQAFAVEMEFEVLEPHALLTPCFVLVNQEGVHLFESFDLDPDWRRRPRPVGRYVSTGYIPGNLLAEGSFFVSPACISLEPHHVQFYVEEAIAFQIVDGLHGDSARGDFLGEMLGVVRPLLKWTTHFSPRT